MKLRSLYAIAACAAGAGMFAASSADAAVTVLGTGLAQSCYQAAEFNTDPKEGVDTCTLALGNQPMTRSDRASTYVNRGILLTRLGDTDGALSDYNRALNINPNLAEGYVDRGANYISMRRYQMALDDIDKGLSLGASKPHIAYYDRAIVHEWMGDIRAAYEDYKRAVALQPDFALALQQLQRFKVVRKPASGA